MLQFKLTGLENLTGLFKFLKQKTTCVFAFWKFSDKFLREINKIKQKKSVLFLFSEDNHMSNCFANVNKLFVAFLIIYQKTTKTAKFNIKWIFFA